MLVVFFCMTLPLRTAFDRTHPDELHYIYGANCFHHAIGYPDAVIFCERFKDDALFANYMTLFPGSAMPDASKSLLGFYEDILNGCLEEGMTDTGKDIITKEGSRTIALLIGEGPAGGNDFHFAYLNENNEWEAKVPMRGVKLYRSIEELESDSKYKFMNFFQCPNGLTPMALRNIQTETVNIGAAKLEMATDTFENIKHLPFQQFIFMTGQRFMFCSANEAITPLPTLNSAVNDNARAMQP